MSKHPPGLNDGRYRCCCIRAEEGALIVGILGLLLTWYNPVSIVAHVVLIIGFFAQHHYFHFFYIDVEIRIDFLVSIYFSTAHFCFLPAGITPTGYSLLETTVIDLDGCGRDYWNRITRQQAQNHVWILLIDLGCVNCVLLVITVIALIVFRAAYTSILRSLAANAGTTSGAFFGISCILLSLNLVLQVWFIFIVERSPEYLQKKKERKRGSNVVSASNDFAGPATAGPAYPPSTPIPSPTEFPVSGAAVYPEAPHVAQGNLYPSVDSAA